MEEYIVYTTYYLEGINQGFSNTIHSNNINKIIIKTNDITKHKIGFNFVEDVFVQNIEYDKLFFLIQVQPNINGIRPKHNEWKKIEVDNFQNINNERFEIDLKQYNNWDKYEITSDINYPIKSTYTKKDLSFGEETVLIGNVGGTIKADVFTTEIYIELPMGEFNSTNNHTWNGQSSVYITEVGIYDENENLVAIGKYNNPIEKNSKISRTLLFSIDF